MSVPLLRRVLARDCVNRLWGRAREGRGTPNRRCPACERRMLEVEVPTPAASLKLDVCRTCEFVSFVRWVRLPAWAAFALWIMLQGLGALEQVSGFGRVSALAHLGGAAVGVLAWYRWRKGEAA